MTTTHHEQSEAPSPDDRRRAVARALGRAPTFLRFAARYAPSPEDAEDAYQGAMEIALQSAPSIEPRRFDAWLYAVVRNEALAASRRRRREAPETADDLAAGDRAVAADARRPDVIAEWRERHADVKEALTGLSDTQRSCLILQTAGLGHDQIAELTGRGARQVERAISRGRARLVEWEKEVATGGACERLRPAIEHVARGGGRPVDQRRVAGHVRRCVPCREVLAARRRLDPKLIALVPAALLSAGPVPMADPGIVVGYADRFVTSAGARFAQAGQLMMELPAAGAGRLGAKGLAVLAAAVAGLPFVTSQIDAEPVAPPPVVVSAPAPTATPPPPIIDPVPARPPAPTRPTPANPASAASPKVPETATASPTTPEKPAPARTAAEPLPEPRPAAAPPKSGPSSPAATPAPKPSIEPAPRVTAARGTPRPVSPPAPQGSAAAEFGP